jgi:hypothetical protein
MAWNRWKNTDPANKTRHTHSSKQKTDCGVLIVGGNDVTEESSADEIAFKIITLGTLLVNRCKVGRVVICALTTRFPMSEFRFKKYGKTEEKVLRFTGGFARRFFI